MAKFLIADDHPLYREALVGALFPLFDDIKIVESDDLDSTIVTLRANTDIDLALLDLDMSGCENLYGLINILKDFPNIPVAVISATDSIKVIRQVMTLGAKGFIPKSTPTKVIANALGKIVEGETWLPEGMVIDAGTEDASLDIFRLVSELTPKQSEVLKLVKEGLLNKQIAYSLNITEATVKAHISAILRKLNVNTRTQAVLLLQELEAE
ncbi:response regulator transcription factor [Paraglaciecola aquimarina]|uniref:Response regulator transcription factor n=1 Tax=Paraglaciecola aquimarina TaxID=1235557 RepID=A0ABU3SY60_9ALTE|nr:response regulator transcription factor [Paraglaciecola aquimarina]MDU0354952.1 response regulator transcription factor [Paraglaciecola aquimarina]